MNGQGRGSAVAVSMVVVAMLCIAVVQTAEGATFMVGGSGGWTFNVAGWPKGKRFRAGDTLVFKYSPSIHNVVVVDKGGYTGCKPGSGAKTYQTGNDQIKLNKGSNFFICTIPGHCQSGMKIAVNAA